MSDIDTTLPRETGSAKSESTCPTCGATLPAVTSRYGSVTAGSCPNCTGEALDVAEKALQQDVAERGYPLGDPSADWKTGQLEAYAADAGVDLSGNKGSKAAMVEAIGETRVPEQEHPQA